MSRKIKKFGDRKRGLRYITVLVCICSMFVFSGCQLALEAENRSNQEDYIVGFFITTQVIGVDVFLEEVIHEDSMDEDSMQGEWTWRESTNEKNHYWKEQLYETGRFEAVLVTEEIELDDGTISVMQKHVFENVEGNYLIQRTYYDEDRYTGERS